jgi:hypothetical protein
MVNTKSSTLELSKVQSKMTMIVKTKVTIELQFSLTPERPSSHNIPQVPKDYAMKQKSAMCIIERV